MISITADSIYRLGVARKNLDEHGEVIADFNGKLTKSPWVQITKDYQAIFHAGVRELGLSSWSRAKLAMYQVEANADISKEDAFFDNIWLHWGDKGLPLCMECSWKEYYCL